MADSSRIKEMSYSNVTDASSGTEIFVRNVLWSTSRKTGTKGMVNEIFQISSALRPDAAYQFDLKCVITSPNPQNFITILIAFILELIIVVISSTFLRF
jgi:hypothetical protein